MCSGQISRYRQLITHQIKPHFGAMQVQKIKAVHLNAFYAQLLQSGGIDGGPLAALTVGHVHRVLRRIFGHAAQWGVIAANPAALVHPPRVAQNEIEIIRVCAHKDGVKCERLHTLISSLGGRFLSCKARENPMSDEKVTLDRIDFEKLKKQCKAARAEYMRRAGAAALGMVGSKLRAHHVIAVVAVLLISFGVKMFFFSAPTAEANIRAVPSVSWPLP